MIPFAIVFITPDRNDEPEVVTDPMLRACAILDLSIGMARSLPLFVNIHAFKTEVQV